MVKWSSRKLKSQFQFFRWKTTNAKGVMLPWVKIPKTALWRFNMDAACMAGYCATPFHMLDQRSLDAHLQDNYAKERIPFYDKRGTPWSAVSAAQRKTGLEEAGTLWFSRPYTTGFRLSENVPIWEKVLQRRKVEAKHTKFWSPPIFGYGQTAARNSWR